MSASPSGSSKARSPLPELPRPQLTVVPRLARHAPRLPFVALVVGLLVAGLVGLLLLNTGMERGAYTVTSLRAQVAALTVKHESLQLQVAGLRNPQVVAERALRLGMVANTSPAFISLRTGKVSGISVPGAVGDRFDVGTFVSTSVGRLGKVAPLVGGEGVSAGVTATEPGSPSKHGRTKGSDTAATSPGNAH